MLVDGFGSADWTIDEKSQIFLDFYPSDKWNYMAQSFKERLQYLVKSKTTDTHSSLWILAYSEWLAWHKKISNCLIINLRNEK